MRFRVPRPVPFRRKAADAALLEQLLLGGAAAVRYPRWAVRRALLAADVAGIMALVVLLPRAPLPQPAPKARSVPTVSAACQSGPARSVIVESRYRSRILAGPHALYIYVPAGYCASSGRYPVVYLLHGAPGSAADWLTNTGVQQTMDQLIAQGRVPPMLIVMPDGNYGELGDTFWANGNAAAGFGRAEDYVVQEIVPFVDATYRTIAGRAGRAIGGLSAGAYGSVNIAVHHPDMFGAVAAMSGFYRAGLTDGGVDLFAGDAQLQHANSPIELLDDVSEIRSVALYFDVGDQDPFFVEDSKDFDRELTARGIDHEFHIYPGAHTWDYWAAHLPDALRFVGQHLQPAPACGTG